jgi:hypothetical protein
VATVQPKIALEEKSFVAKFFWKYSIESCELAIRQKLIL